MGGDQGIGGASFPLRQVPVPGGLVMAQGRWRSIGCMGQKLVICSLLQYMHGLFAVIPARQGKN